MIPLTEKQKVHAKLLMIRGTPPGVIASKLNVTDNSIVELIGKPSKYGPKAIFHDLPGHEKKAKTADLKQAGYTNLQISNMMDVPESVINNWLTHSLMATKKVEE